MNREVAHVELTDLRVVTSIPPVPRRIDPRQT